LLPQKIACILQHIVVALPYDANAQGDSRVSDLYGHGTHVAGIIAGSGARSSGGNFDYWIRGIAPNAEVINLRVLDSTGMGTDSAVITALEKAVELKHQFHIDSCPSWWRSEAPCELRALPRE
jgi:hypothetical protein